MLLEKRYCILLQKLSMESNKNKFSSKFCLPLEKHSPKTVSCIGFPVTTNPSASSASHCHLPSSSSLTLSIYKFPVASTRNRCPTTRLLYVLSFRTVCTICPSFSQMLVLKFMLTEHSSTSFTFCLEYNCI